MNNHVGDVRTRAPDSLLDLARASVGLGKRAGCVQREREVGDETLVRIDEAQLAQVSNRLNVVMKQLSAWAGIILVPTLIAGIYGMNFRNMPELTWQIGYPLALGLMLVSAGMLYRIFKKREWL